MVGRPRQAVAAGAVAGELAEFLQALSTQGGKTYTQLSAATSPQISVATLCRAASGKRRPKLTVVRAFVLACGGTPSELRKAERLWRRTPPAAPPGRGKRPGTRWREPESLSNEHQLGDLMRLARTLSGSPSLRTVQGRADALGVSLSKNALGHALRQGSLPSRQLFCAFMRVISDFDGSPAARYEAEVWEELWDRVRTDRYPPAPSGPLARAVQKEPGAGSRASAAVTGGTGPVRRRPRRAPSRAWVRPGPVRKFKDWLHELYATAGMPSLTDIVAAVRTDDTLAAVPARDSVNRLLRSSSLGSQADAVAVAVVLARMAGKEPVTEFERAQSLWIQAAVVRPYGYAVSEMTDPLVLGVRETFSLPDAEGPLSVLAPYIRRHHDHEIGNAVRRAVEGHSTMVVARGKQATGKTRSCWESLRGLPGGWRLWHPADPSSGKQVVEALSQAGPETVVWLDRIDRYLDPARCQAAGEIHAEIQDALHDPRRAPVLIIGTISSTADILTRSGGLTSSLDSLTRTLIDDSAVDVPDRFARGDLEDLAEAAERDPRLALAESNARGSVTQFLAADRNADPMLKARALHKAVGQGDTNALFMGGVLLEQSGRLREATAWYQRAAEAGDVLAIEPAATLLSEGDRPHEAINWLCTLAEAGDANAAIAAARRLLRAGLDHEAVKVYQRAFEVSGNHDALRAAASLMSRTGRTEEAVEWLRAQAARGHPIALREAARLLWGTGDTTRALRFYADAGSAGDPEAWRDAAEHLERLGRDDEAIIMYRAAAGKGDNLSVLPLADLLAARGRHDEALEIYLKIASKGDLAAIWRAATVYRTSRRPKRALHWFRKAARKGDPKAFMQIGLILRDKCESNDRPVNQKDVDKAVAAFTRAAAVGERHAHREAAWLLWRQRGTVAAEAWLQQRVDAKDERAARELGDFLREAGKPKHALAWYSKAADDGSRSSAARALHLQAKLP
ncbi:tetratricopeptide repeat protein [Kitasatospora sp. NPDC058184]|uniref:tetratricopeptide repeat protein n=1 Tax=Kitasatospora sp. NPDC058184 TaxID=3346370 RepID=UPI0036DDAFB6